MPVVLLLAVAAILGGVIAVAIGRGGELASFAADVPAVQLRIETAADVAQIRPPSALFGYSPQVTDDVLSAVAQTVSDRDAEIAELRERLAELEGQPGHRTDSRLADSGSWSAWDRGAPQPRPPQPRPAAPWLPEPRPPEPWPAEVSEPEPGWPDQDSAGAGA